MIKRLPTLLIFFVFSNQLLFSQDKSSTIKGTILNTEGNFAEVNVLLLSVKDSVIIKSVLSDNNGVYQINNVKDGKYLLSFLKIGYQTAYYGEIIIDHTKPTIIIPSVELFKLNKQLKEVIVKGKTPYIEHRNGKTIINVENSVFGLGNSGYEILQTIPGISIDNNNQLSIQGKNNVTVFIDGKPTNLSGDNLVEYLKNIQTNNIEQIELLNSTSARYDAANNGGIINIKFKKGKNMGSNGIFSLGGGLGKNYRYNTALSLNHRTQKSNLYLNYDFNKIKAVDNTFLLRNIHNQGKNTLFDVTNTDLKTRDNHNILLGFDYTINKNNAVGFLVNAFSNKMISDEQNQSLVYNTTLDSAILSQSLEHRNINNASLNLNYNGILNKKGTSLKADLDYLNYDRKSDENLSSIYYRNPNPNVRLSTSEYKPRLKFDNQTPSNIYILSAKTDLSQPISKNSSLDGGLKISHVSNRSDRKINITSGQGYIFNPSTLFNYKEDIYAAYISFVNKTDKNNLEIGLRAEETHAMGDTSSYQRLIDRSYLNLFPNFSFSTKLNENNSLTFSFNRGISRPNYEDLNPFFYFLDQYTYNQGNPKLQPAYNNSSKIDWELKEKYHFSLQYNYIKNFVYSVFEQNNTNNIAITRRMNFDYRQTVGFEVGIPVTLTPWWDFDFNTQAYYEFFKYNDSRFGIANNESTSILSDFNNTFSISKGVNAQLNFHYESPTSYGIYTFKPLYYLNFGISKPVLKNKGSLRFTIADVFDNNSNRYATQYYNLDLNAKEKTETRSFRLAFSYKFGKKEVKAYRRRNLGANEEKNRVGQ